MLGGGEDGRRGYESNTETVFIQLLIKLKPHKNKTIFLRLHQYQ